MKKNCALVFGSVILSMIFTCGKTEKKKADFPNTLKNTHWIIDSGGLIAPEGEKVYYLSKRIDTALILNFHAIDFLDEEKFRSYDSWECGNDCFTEVHGRYYFTEPEQIEMEVDSITTRGTCEAPAKIFKPVKVMTFQISKEKAQLRLTRK